MKLRVLFQEFITKEIIIRTERLRKKGLARNKSDSAATQNPGLHTDTKTSHTHRRNGVAAGGGGVGLEGGGGLERSSRSTRDGKLTLPY